MTMSEFEHSQILFSSSDGIPLEFNIQYAKDKEYIKSLIEHGGGLCTLKDNVTHLVSPGTTVLNVNSGVTLVSTSYIFDCVEKNYLLHTDEYRFVINEMEASDISDCSQNASGVLMEQNCTDNNVNNSNDIINDMKIPSLDSLPLSNSNHDFDFQDSKNSVNSIGNNEKDINVTPLQPTIDISIKPSADMIGKEFNETCINSESSESVHTSVNNKEKENQKIIEISKNDEIVKDYNHADVELNNHIVSVDADIVSSSQPGDSDVNLFDSVALEEAKEKPVKILALRYLI